MASVLTCEDLRKLYSDPCEKDISKIREIPHDATRVPSVPDEDYFSKVSGVYYHFSKGEWRLVFRDPEQRSKRCQKTFSIRKYGFYLARKKAEDLRFQLETLHNWKPSPRSIQKEDTKDTVNILFPKKLRTFHASCDANDDVSLKKEIRTRHRALNGGFEDLHLDHKPYLIPKRRRETRGSKNLNDGLEDNFYESSDNMEFSLNTPVEPISVNHPSPAKFYTLSMSSLSDVDGSHPRLPYTNLSHFGSFHDFLKNSANSNVSKLAYSWIDDFSGVGPIARADGSLNINGNGTPNRTTNFRFKLEEAVSNRCLSAPSCPYNTELHTRDKLLTNSQVKRFASHDFDEDVNYTFSTKCSCSSAPSSNKNLDGRCYSHNEVLYGSKSLESCDRKLLGLIPYSSAMDNHFKNAYAPSEGRKVLDVDDNMLFNTCQVDGRYNRLTASFSNNVAVKNMGCKGRMERCDNYRGSPYIPMASFEGLGNLESTVTNRFFDNSFHSDVISCRHNVNLSEHESPSYISCGIHGGVVSGESLALCKGDNGVFEASMAQEVKCRAEWDKAVEELGSPLSYDVSSAPKDPFMSNKDDLNCGEAVNVNNQFNSFTHFNPNFLLS